ncbi:MAG: hypothetical protein V7K21_14845 [Nostoc sp.]|uniref:hypothetical protein n=1 Tax=Nostoc sp. TaxID=1180 RepID=UPI002FFCBBDE
MSGLEDVLKVVADVSKTLDPFKSTPLVHGKNPSERLAVFKKEDFEKVIPPLKGR